MCIAIVKPEGTVISDETLIECYTNNPDGAGIAYARDNHIVIVKGIFSTKELIKQVRKAEQVAEGAMLIHCRIGTSGPNNKVNCHPHIVNDQCVLIHNGILDIDVPKNSKVSDTILYIQEFLKELPKDFMHNKAMTKLIEDHIGSHNKFCLLDNKGNYTIINEKAGEWEDGIWYSNWSYIGYRGYTFKDYEQYEELDMQDQAAYFELADLINEDIDNMSIDEMEYLTEDPVVNFDTFRLEPPYAKYNGDSRVMELYKFNQDLYWLYIDKWDEFHKEEQEVA